MKNGRFTSQNQKHKSMKWLWALSAFCLMLPFAPVRGQDLWSSGANSYGQLANGTKTGLETMTKVDSTGTWTLVRGGSFFFIGQKSDGSLWSCGNNGYGQLGDGTTVPKTQPVMIDANHTWSKIATMKGTFGLAIRADGTLWGVGDNSDGEHADGGTTKKTVFTQIGTDSNWMDVSAGQQQWIGLKKNGTLWGCGVNTRGQLGDSTTISKKIIIQIGKDSTWVKISMGGNHTLALKADGSLWAWGYNAYGQIGDSTSGTGTNKIAPIQIGKSKDWAEISAGGSFSMATKKDGSLWGWGYNVNGQLGNGATTNVIAPTQIGTDTDWLTISAGTSHVLALKTNGTLWSWGDNTYGQIGFNAASATTPTQIGTATDWKAISASSTNSSYALKASASSGIANGTGEGSLAINYDEASTSISISGTETAAQVIVCNLQGQLLFNTKLAGGSALPINGLAKGIYLVKAKSESASASKKIVIR
ncbi:MAG: hypothetical protein BGN96_06695 [Bacteroidales bacterium 45-6]|nr:MAG: hypothetical protein BGN96_06695 [Bacteroidales bacterium 45-6]